MGRRDHKRLPASTDALPAGDFRAWWAIDAWATHIAGELEAVRQAPG